MKIFLALILMITATISFAAKAKIIPKNEAIQIALAIEESLIRKDLKCNSVSSETASSISYSKLK